MKKNPGLYLDACGRHCRPRVLVLRMDDDIWTTIVHWCAGFYGSRPALTVPCEIHGLV